MTAPTPDNDDETVEAVPARGEGDGPWPPHDVDDADEQAEAIRVIVGGKGIPKPGIRPLGDGTGRVAVYDRKTKTGKLVGVITRDQYVAALEDAAKVTVLDGDGLDSQGNVHPEVRSVVDEKRRQLERQRKRWQDRLDAIDAELAALE